MKTVLIILISLVALFLVVSLAAGYYMYRFAIMRNKKTKDFWSEDITQPKGLPDDAFAIIKDGERFAKTLSWEKVCIKSRDGLRLVGHLYEKPGAKGLFLMAHGYKSCGIFDFSGAVQPISELG